MIENGILKPSGVIQLRGGLSSVLKKVNPLPARRELMVEIDTGKIKVGDGTHRWNELTYSGNGISVPPNDGKVYSMKNGAWIEVDASGAVIPERKIFNVILTSEQISQKYIQLPNDCDTSKLINLYIQGLLTERGLDWELDENKISWNGLELENIVQAGDKIFIDYYKEW